MVQIIVANAQADAGKGYYNCLLRKADKVENPDASLRQIDVDLARTLPTNIHFNTMDSDKMGQLKRVLYAFRFHNKSVEYCQGLNRIAAVALLYLREDDAFWFLVAVVCKKSLFIYQMLKFLGRISSTTRLLYPIPQGRNRRSEGFD